MAVESTKTLKTRIVLRHDIAQNWQTNNPVLKNGEVGLETDTYKLKVGDGVKAWKDLRYYIAPMGFYEVTVNNGGDHMAAINAAVGTNVKEKGDTAVVKETISGDKVAYSGYVWDGSAWKAMDGNYNAENVYFDQDLITTSAIGNITLTNGQATIPANGKNLKQVFDTIFVKAKDPAITQPSCGVRCPEARGYEVGTSVTPTYTTSFNAGNYQYGPATGVTASSWSVLNGTKALTTPNGTFEAIVVGDDTNYKLTATVQHTKGANPKNNIGEEKANLAIQAGSKAATSGTITGFRKMFYGSSTSVTAMNSGSIRALSGSQQAAEKTFDMNVIEGAKHVVIAVPEGRTLRAVKDKNAFGTDIFGSFTLSKINVEGANGYTAKSYNVYEYKPAAPLGANTYTLVIA